MEAQPIVEDALGDLLADHLHPGVQLRQGCASAPGSTVPLGPSWLATCTQGCTTGGLPWGTWRTAWVKALQQGWPAGFGQAGMLSTGAGCLRMVPRRPGEPQPPPQQLQQQRRRPTPWHRPVAFWKGARGCPPRLAAPQGWLLAGPTATGGSPGQPQLAALPSVPPFAALRLRLPTSGRPPGCGPRGEGAAGGRGSCAGRTDQPCGCTCSPHSPPPPRLHPHQPASRQSSPPVGAEH